MIRSHVLFASLLVSLLALPALAQAAPAQTPATDKMHRHPHIHGDRSSSHRASHTYRHGKGSASSGTTVSAPAGNFGSRLFGSHNANHEATGNNGHTAPAAAPSAPVAAPATPAAQPAPEKKSFWDRIRGKK